METYIRSQQSQQIPQGRKIQNGDTRNNQDLPPDRGVGNIHRFQGPLLPYTHPEPVQKIPAFPRQGSDLSVQSSNIWSVHSTYGVHCSGQRGQTDGFAERYKDPPVPRRLVGPGQIPPNLSPIYTNSSSYLSGWRGGSQTSLQLHRLPVRPERGQAQTHPRLVADPYSKDPRIIERTSLSGLAADVPHRPVHSHRKAGSPRSTPYEAHTLAPEK